MYGLTRQGVSLFTGSFYLLLCSSFDLVLDFDSGTYLFVYTLSSSNYQLLWPGDPTNVFPLSLACLFL